MNTIDYAQMVKTFQKHERELEKALDELWSVREKGEAAKVGAALVRARELYKFVADMEDGLYQAWKAHWYNVSSDALEKAAEQAAPHLALHSEIRAKVLGVKVAGGNCDYGILNQHVRSHQVELPGDVPITEPRSTVLERATSVNGI